MRLDYFAGAIFTPQEALVFGVFAFLITGSVAGIIIFLGKKLVNRGSPRNPKRENSLFATMMLGFGVVAVIILGFFVIPALIRDHNWVKKQDRCALDAGFTNRFETDSATIHNLAEKQTLYHSCLYPNE